MNAKLKIGTAVVISAMSIMLAHAQTVTWNRQDFGQQEIDPCGSMFNWPNDNSWDIQEIDSTGCNQPYILQPSNWSTPTYPNGSTFDVILTAAGAPVGLDIAATLHSLTVQSGAGDINMTSGSSFNCQSYDFQTDGTFTSSLNHGHGGANPVIEVQGTFAKTAGAGILDISGHVSGSEFYFDMEGGTVQVTSGTLKLSRGESTGATFTISANAVVDLTNGSNFVDWNGAFGGSGAGAAQLNNGGIQIQNAGSTFNFTGGLFQWAGGYIFAGGNTPRLTNLGTMNLVGSGAKEIDGGGFHNAGMFIQTGTGNLVFGGNSYMTNDAAGTYDVQSDSGMGSNGEIDNYGIFKKSAGTGTSTIFGGDPGNFYFIHYGGTVEVDSGTLQLPRNYPNVSTGATFIVAAGALLDLNTGSASNYNGTYTGTGGGAVQLNTGGLQVGIFEVATFNFAGNLFQWNGGYISAGGPFTNTGTMTLAGSGAKEIDGTGFHNAGTMIQTGTGNLQFGGDSFMTNDASGTYDIRSDAGFTNGQFLNSGTFKKSAGTGTSMLFSNNDPNTVYFQILGGTVEADSGTLMLARSYPSSTGGNFIVGAGAVIDLNSGGTAGNYSGTYTGSGAGALQINSGGISIIDSGATFNFSGNLFQWNGGFILNSVLAPSVFNAGTINIAGNVEWAGFGMTNNGTIKGSGSLSFSGSPGSLINNGTIAPGSSPGQLNVGFNNGGLTLGYPSQLSFEVGGTTAATQYDVLNNSTGTPVNLNGKISATLISGFTPQPADTFTVFTTQNALGGFFTNVANGGRMNTEDGTGSFQVTYHVVNNPVLSQNVTLSNFGPALSPSQGLNISSRASVGTGENVAIGGFIITGTDPKKVIVRGIGPSLTGHGVQAPLADPTLELHTKVNNIDTVLATDDNWKDTQQAEIQASQLAPSNDLESAIIATLAPGSYTAILQGKASSTGVGLIEVYDLDPAGNSRLGNISTRGFVGTGQNVLIGGTIIGPTSTNSSSVVVRAIGPSLQGSNISNPLMDPTLELHDANGVLFAVNDNWKDLQQADIEAAGLAPTNDAESAILIRFAPGNWTAIVRGKNNTTGVALVEVYNIPDAQSGAAGSTK